MFPFTFTKRSAQLLRCDPALLYEVLTDYDSYREWMPLIAQSKLLAKEGDLAIAEFELAGSSKDMFVVECIHTKNRMVLWRPIRGKLPVDELQWDIEAAQEGQTKVTITIEGRRGLPGLSNPYCKLTDAGRCLKALEAHLSVFLPELGTDAEGEKIMEIAETGEGLICWLQGKKYILTIAEGSHD